MRILHVVPTYLPATRYGGPIQSVHGLCKALVELGHEVHVYTSSLDGDGRLNVPEGTPVILDGVQVWYFRCRLIALCWLPSMRARLNASMADFDAVHLHSVFLWPMAKAARVARRHAVPYVVSPRGMLVPELIARRSAIAKRAWIYLIERRTLRQAQAIHVTSPLEADDLRRCNLDLAPIAVLPNGTDIQTDFAREPRRNQWLFLGRLSWKKNLSALIDALAMVESIELILAGPDEEGIAAQLLDRAAQANCSARVRWIGEVDGPAKRELLRTAECLVLPSLNENFGNVVVEALAQACPVLVTPQVGARHIVEASAGGMIADGTSAQSLAHAMRELNADPARLTDLGIAGQRYVREHLSWVRVAADMSTIYRNNAR